MCLDDNNQQLWHCRRPEQLLNACVFDKLVRSAPPPHLSRSALAYMHITLANPIEPFLQKLEKKIPGTPENETPVHLRDRQIFSHNLSSWRRKTERPSRGEVQADRSAKVEKSEKPE